MVEKTVELTQVVEKSAGFSLPYFEFLVCVRRYEAAGRLLVLMLDQLDTQYGRWDVFSLQQQSIQQQEHYCNRLAAAIGNLLSDPGFVVSDKGFLQLINFHRWIALIFAASPFGHADHVITNLNQAGEGCAHPLRFERNNFLKFCLMYLPESGIPLQPDILWQFNPHAAAALFLALLSPRILPSAVGHAKREQLLAWLPEKLLTLESLEGLPERILHDVYMHCSYADMAEKHAIKRSINVHLRNTLLHNGLSDNCSRPPSRSKPLMLVILEWFNSGHSIYRTHSSTLRAAREQFSTHGATIVEATDATTREVFDDFTEVQRTGAVEAIAVLAKKLRPDVIYFPSVGMFPLTIALTNLRLAPLQIMALGHPATTHSSYIDAVLVEEDYLGDPRCFSEKVVSLPKDCLPYVPPANIRPPEPVQHFDERSAVHIAVCASAMKINPRFIATCAEIAQRTSTPVIFHFLVGFCWGITHRVMEKAINAVIPQAKIYEHLAYQDYLLVINQCDLFINPFPFGNTNGIVDTVRQGLPGVCLSGAEVHEHIDEGLFRRLGLSEELITHDLAEYIAVTVRLITDTEWRNSLRCQLLKIQPDNVLFSGKPEQFGLIIRALLDDCQAER
ncbi:putative accessory processing protein [Yersinia intermedia]|uniref:glycosyl transferase n=1 Tax=Yersinia intermedia TaxID=631 RepID=UPI0005AC2AF2|nr:glycosyl transferase [Yersinia intermedia]AJJ18956.1 glycosyl transferase 41 family protein [Yersinia intermedia]MDA5512511.1 glycosyltransferase [Yersinia intermedia]OVZ74875.1 glycosyltransferase [Yersinia intermedia]CNI59562.1 putative accessory processing protein [Yersinia intermedia]CQD80142.1 putative accessory processing protein [Yersinia intermedia]